MSGSREDAKARREGLIEEADFRWATLGDVAVNLDSKRRPVTKSARTPGSIPYYGASGIVDYVSDYIFDGNFLLVSEDGANLLARSTPIAFSISGKTWVNNHAHVLQFNTYAERRFIEIYLNSIDLAPFVSGGAQPKLNQANLNSIPVPVPPLEVQREIVRVLDTFTTLEAELEAELEARRRQYQYYRDTLLGYAEDDDVQWAKLIDLTGSITTGKLNANAMVENGEYPFFTCDANPFRIDNYAFDTEAILVSGNGSQVGHINYYKGRFNAYQRTYVLSDFENIQVRYLLHYLQAFLRDYIIRISKKGSVPYITL
ncbi:MAG: restriction endonuclease subunit S, partial [Caldilineaceae bacterium]|nr:restriction endonuclease subunit S [Caldilineaceae bacterium]